MSATWTCCPACNSPFIIRLGTVGIPNKADSNSFKCESCGTTFTAKGGETILEGLRSKGL